MVFREKKSFSMKEKERKCKIFGNSKTRNIHNIQQKKVWIC